MKITIRVQRKYSTEIEVEAESIETARSNYMNGQYDDAIHTQELEQCNVVEVDTEIRISNDYVVNTIELPNDFFPAHSVEIICEPDDIEYKVIVYGFDGNIMYEDNTNVYLMRDESDEEYIQQIGEYLCDNWTIKY